MSKSYPEIENDLTDRIESKELQHSRCTEDGLSGFLARLYNDRGHARYMQVNFDDAVEDYSKALKYDKDLAVAFYNRGTVHYRMGCYVEAMADLTQALKLEPINIEFQEAFNDCCKIISSKQSNSGMQTNFNKTKI